MSKRDEELKFLSRISKQIWKQRGKNRPSDLAGTSTGPAASAESLSAWCLFSLPQGGGSQRLPGGGGGGPAGSGAGWTGGGGRGGGGLEPPPGPPTPLQASPAVLFHGAPPLPCLFSYPAPARAWLRLLHLLLPFPRLRRCVPAWVVLAQGPPGGCVQGPWSLKASPTHQTGLMRLLAGSLGSALGREVRAAVSRHLISEVLSLRPYPGSRSTPAHWGRGPVTGPGCPPWGGVCLPTTCLLLKLIGRFVIKRPRVHLKQVRATLGKQEALFCWGSPRTPFSRALRARGPPPVLWGNRTTRMLSHPFC